MIVSSCFSYTCDWPDSKRIRLRHDKFGYSILVASDSIAKANGLQHLMECNSSYGIFTKVEIDGIGDSGGCGQSERGGKCREKVSREFQMVHKDVRVVRFLKRWSNETGFILGLRFVSCFVLFVLCDFSVGLKVGPSLQC